MGYQALPYAELSLEIARAHPEKLPPTVSLAEYERDWVFYRFVLPRLVSVQEVVTLLTGGSSAVRSDIMSTFVTHYAYLNRFDNDPSIQGSVARMGNSYE